MNKIITREIFSYAFFGVLTTVVNVVVYALFYYVFGVENITSTVVAWLFSVTFAYLTNRKWVFKSTNGVVKEGTGFFVLRGVSEVFDVLIMHVGVDVFRCKAIAVKIFANIVVILLNYLFSKMYIFKKKE